MPRQVAFLRAVNVGNRRVSMARLKEAFDALGFGDVSTFIASGNVIFRAGGTGADLERQIEPSLAEVLGFEVVAFVRPGSRIARIAGGHPFTGSDDLVQVGFLKKPPGTAGRRRVEMLSTDTDTLSVQGREVYWLARAGMGRASVSGAAVEKALGGPTTFRGVPMLTRLAAKL